MLLRRLIKGTFRAIAAGLLVVVGLVMMLFIAMGVDHRTRTVLPLPTGPFAVGRTSFDWVDPTVADELAPAPGAKREIVAWVWYPAARSSAVHQAEYLPPSWRAANLHNSGMLMSRFLTRDLSLVQSHSSDASALSATDRTYPVVILRAGGGALTTSFTSLAEDLASRGYVVVGLDAPYMTTFVVLTDGRVITRPPQYNPETLAPPAAVRLANRLLPIWCRDIGFVLDQLTILNASDPVGRFTGRLDLQRVGLVGHSFGGATAAEFCSSDSRCQAGIDLDGMLFGRVIQKGLRQPFMFILSDQDASATEAKQVFADIQWVYNRLPPGTRAKIKILGTTHLSFSDQMLIKSQPLLWLAHRLGALPTDGRRGIAITADYVGAFFDVHLKGRPDDRLRELQVKYPEVRVL